MDKAALLSKLIHSYENSPHPSIKVTNYFHIYVDLFGHLVDKNCTFIETGILNGGSLFMWKSWLGDKARIVGIDLNPNAKKWCQHGFEIYIGDQGDPKFWQETLLDIGGFDALLDDGGHQSFQQIVTLTESIKFGKPESVIVVEDTLTSHMRDFSDHRNHSFLEYAKDSTDILSARNNNIWKNQFPAIKNQTLMDTFADVYSVEFFTGIVAYKLNPAANISPEAIWNKPPETSEADYRHTGLTKSAAVDWPDPFTITKVIVDGQS